MEEDARAWWTLLATTSYGFIHLNRETRGESAVVDIASILRQALPCCLVLIRAMAGSKCRLSISSSAALILVHPPEKKLRVPGCSGAS